MEMLTPRQKKAQESKDRILTAAMELIENYGYDALTIKNICARADVSNGTFFHYFKTKDELLSYYLVKGRQTYLEQAANEAGSDDVRRNVIRIYSSYTEYCEKNGLKFISNYYSTSNQALNNHNPDTKGPETISYDDVLAELKSAQQKGLILPELLPETLSDDICVIIKGIIFDWCLSQGRANMRQSVERLLGVYFNSAVTEEYTRRFGAYTPAPQPPKRPAQG